MFASKDELEERLAAAFLASIEHRSATHRLPAGAGPDFGVQLSTGVVGIELTRLYRQDRERGVSFRQAEGIWDQVLAGAYSEWRRLGLPDVTVYVRTINASVPQKANVPRLVE